MSEVWSLTSVKIIWEESEAVDGMVFLEITEDGEQVYHDCLL